MNKKEMSDILTPFVAWSMSFEPAFNDNLSEPIDGDFPLQNTLAPDELTVEHLRGLSKLANAVSELRE